MKGFIRRIATTSARIPDLDAGLSIVENRMVTKRFVLKWLFEYRVDLEAEHLADLIHENLIIHSIVGRGFRVESKTIRKVVGLCYDRGILDGYSGRYGNR